MEIPNYDKLNNSTSKIQVNSDAFTIYVEEYLIPVLITIENQWPKFMTIRIIIFSLMSPNEIRIYTALNI